MIRTACPLDCWDACAITCDPSFPNRLVSTPLHPTSNGALCSILNKQMHEAPRIKEPRVNGSEVSMKEALDVIAKALASGNVLHWRGSGNLGVMQSITNLLIKKLGGTRTHGSLCDGAGQAGVLKGRGYNYQLSAKQISKADVVVVWGRNLTVTNSHMMPFIKNKKLIVIDPVSTPIAKKADMHLQIRPRTDFLLAVMLARFVFMEGAEDQEWLEEYADDYDSFYDFTQTFRIKATLESIDTNLQEMGRFLSCIAGKKVVFLVGAGVQKYNIGHYVLWAIDTLAAILGLFGKEGCGVHYMGNSLQGFDDPFKVQTKTVSIVTTPFDKFDTVLVQGGNPAASMPDSNRVAESLKRVGNLIYFGLYENETSQLADIVIPAKTFLEKNDLRLCYGHQFVEPMNRVTKSDIGISEYDFIKEMFLRLGFDGIKDEEEYLSKWIEQCGESEGYAALPDHQEIPYIEGFGKAGDDEFVMIDDYEDDFESCMKAEEYWLITPKESKSINTQFYRNKNVLVPSSAGFNDGDEVIVSSKYAEQKYIAKVSQDLRSDCLLIYSDSIGVNRLTPPIVSEEGEGACYQEIKVTIKRQLCK